MIVRMEFSDEAGEVVSRTWVELDSEAPYSPDVAEDLTRLAGAALHDQRCKAIAVAEWLERQEGEA